MNKNKKPLIIALVCVAAAAAIAAGIWFFVLRDYFSAANASPVYVNSVSSIVGLDTGKNPRYSGIVEPQQTYKVEKDSSRTVSDIYVVEGDYVAVGDALFSYDTQELQWSLDQANIDLERIASSITTLKSQLATLNADKKKADKDEQAAFTLQIQAKELEIKTEEYNSTQKKSEIEKLTEQINNSTVFSDYEGTVKEINANDQTDSSGRQKSFISILSDGEYRVKGTVSELNFGSISVGQAVVVHSRLDTSVTWKGTIESIDTENTDDTNSDNYYYYSYDSGEKSSKYNFYVVLESPEGLILGQHVYIEPDLGDNAKKEGVWLPAMYIAHDDDGSFVWAESEKGKLEKRDILLGEYDKDNDSYEIKGGLAKTDSIAYPNESLKVGMPTTTDAAYQGDYTDDGALDDGFIMDDYGYDGTDDSYTDGDYADYDENYTDSDYNYDYDEDYSFDTGDMYDADFTVEPYYYEDYDGSSYGEGFVE